MTGRRLLLALMVAALFGAGGTDAFAASLVKINGGATIFYAADTNEVNDLVVTRTASDYVFDDPGAAITGSSGCSGSGGTQGTCPAAGVTDIEINLADENDSGTVSTATPSIIRGGIGEDILTGGDADDRLEGEEDGDTLNGAGGDDRLEAEDLLSPGTASNDLDGGPGADQVIGGAGGDTAQGGTGNDTVSGNAGVDDLDGGADSDEIIGGDDDDLMRGGSGDDRVGSDSLTIGGIPPDRGDDTLEGGPGNDTLRPGLGPTQGISDDDTFGGDEGFDSVVFDKRTARVEIFLDNAPNDGAPGTERDNVTGDVERLVGGQAGDRLVGGLAADTIEGFRGADTIEGGGGADTLDGGVDDAEGDSLSGGDGGDVLRGNAGDDALQGDQGADALDGGTGSDAMLGGGEPDQLTGGPGIDDLAGGSGDDQLDGAAPVLLGADGGDRLRGDAGNDAMRGGAGDDTLEGGGGADDMRGEGGSDEAEYANADAPVRVSLDSRANDGERAERDNVRTDVENVAGGGVQDTFTGSRGRNRLDGGAGEDFVDGRRGADQLVGGAAIDVVRARDGRTRDTVRCGRGKDFAIVGREDRVLGDCEGVDNGIRRVPRAGVAFLLRPLRGANGFGPPGMRRTVPLQDRLRVPMASQVDARKGSVGLAFAGKRARPGGVFSGGMFQVRQGRSRGSITELRLRGIDLRLCRPGGVRGAGHGAAPASLRSRLRARARGPYRARTRHSAGTARGTTFVTEERCDGTLTRVLKGVVRVRDFGRRRTITVRAGKTYLARAR
jgi:Ca2+-binding RTX toxin-like protein